MNLKRELFAKIKLSVVLLLLMIFSILIGATLITAEETKENTNINKDIDIKLNNIEIIYPAAGVYTPNSGTYQPYKNIKSHFILPKITFPDKIASENTAMTGAISKNPIEEYELIESGYTIGRYNATDTEPNTAIITTYGLHKIEIQGYDKLNNTIEKKSVEFYAGFNYDDLYTILQETPMTTIMTNKAAKDIIKKINISYDDYEDINKKSSINKSYSYITSVDKVTNNTLEHTKITIRFNLKENINDINQNQIIIYELYPKSIINSIADFNKLLFSDNFIIIEKYPQDTIVAWNEDNILPFQKEIIKTYYINQKLDQKQIEEITTIIVTENKKSNEILGYIMIVLIIAAIIVSILFYYKNYKKNKHKVEIYTIEENNEKNNQKKEITEKEDAI